MNCIRSGILRACFAYLVTDNNGLSWLVVSASPILHRIDQFTSTLALVDEAPGSSRHCLVGSITDDDGDILCSAPGPETIFNQIVRSQISFNEWRLRFERQVRERAFLAKQAEELANRNRRNDTASDILSKLQISETDRATVADALALWVEARSK
ncbi:MAG: hypothetical protein WCT32_02290 [Patescibacteria group bacterium]|jgi:hypothetical protein